MKKIAASFTRPADTTAYADGDQVADSTSSPTALEFAGAAAKAGRFCRVTGAAFHTDAANTTNAAFDLLLFSGAPTPSNDNAAYALGSGEEEDYCGHISVEAGDWIAASADKVADKVLAKPGIALVPSGTSIYGLLIARGAYTPASGEAIRVELTIETV